MADPIPGNDSDELDWIWVGNRLNQLVDDAVHWVFYCTLLGTTYGRITIDAIKSATP